MDESLFLRAQRLLGEKSRRQLDHSGLCEEIRARQARSPTAQASTRLAPPAPAPADADGAPVADLVLGSAAWRSAARKQGGCFNRAAATRRVNTSATRLTGIFTVAL